MKPFIEPLPVVPIPEGALHIPWIDLEPNQCQWGLTFDEEPSMHYKCCGLPVEGGKTVRKRFCSYHVKWALKDV